MRKVAAIVLLFAGLVVTALPVAAQTKTGTQFYTEYSAAYAKATGFADLLPWMSKAQKEKFASIPPAQQKAMWEMNKQMDPKDVKVVKETPTADGAKLDVTGMGPEKKMIKGTVTLVKEGGAWKLSGEDWVM
jgi:hypothetical protein